MLSFTTSQTIQRPLGEVFAYWSDPEHIPDRKGGEVSYRREDTGPVGVGTRYIAVRKALGLQQETRGEYTAFVPGQRLVESVKAGPASYTVETTFAADGPEKRALRPIRSQAEADHARIKALLEQAR